MTAAKNVGMWYRGVERGTEALDNAWRRANLHQSKSRRQREASEFVYVCDFVLYVCMYVCMYIYIHVCMYVCIY